MRNILLLQTLNNFDDYSAATLIIAAEHGRPVGPNNVAFNDWLDAFTRNNGVHVRAHHDGRRIGNRARKPRDDIPRIAANFLAGVIDFDLPAHSFTIPFDELSDVPFLARVTIDLHQLEQQALNAFLIDHQSSGPFTAWFSKPFLVAEIVTW